MTCLAFGTSGTRSRCNRRGRLVARGDRARPHVYVQWADQFLVERRIISQERDLLALATRLQQWLRASFTSARGKRTFDNPAEYDRLKGGW